MNAQQLENISLLQSNTDILKYHLKVKINFDQRNIECSNSITAVKSLFNKDTLELDFYDNLFVESVRSNDFNLNYKRQNKKIFIDISTVKNDTVNVEIKYYGKPKKFGLEGFVFAELKDQKIVQTINQPNYAPSWFPCDDDPADKAEFEIEIENDSDFVSVSNGKLIHFSSLGKRNKYHYKSFYPIATNLIGFYSSQYKVIKDTYSSISGNELDLFYFVFPKDYDKALKDLSETKQMLQTFENLWGEYPFLKEKYSVSEIIYGRGAIENQTFVGIGKDLFSGKNLHRDVFIHEMAHSWWGNAVGVSSWKDNWLSEGLATYSEAMYFEYHFGKSALNSYMTKFLSENLSGKLHNPDNLFSPHVYYKGAWVFHMIRNIISDSVFFGFLRNYYKHFKYSTASTEDFKKMLESYSGVEFSNFFNQWVYQDYGIIDCSFSYKQKERFLTIKQNDFVFEFPLEVKIIYDNLSFELVSVLMDKKEIVIELTSKENIKEIILDPDLKLLARFKNGNSNIIR